MMNMRADFDVCVIGSGAGGGPGAATLAEADYSVFFMQDINNIGLGRS